MFYFKLTTQKNQTETSGANGQNQVTKSKSFQNNNFADERLK